MAAVALVLLIPNSVRVRVSNQHRWYRFDQYSIHLHGLHNGFNIIMCLLGLCPNSEQCELEWTGYGDWYDIFRHVFKDRQGGKVVRRRGLNRDALARVVSKPHAMFGFECWPRTFLKNGDIGVQGIDQLAVLDVCATAAIP